MESRSSCLLPVRSREARLRGAPRSLVFVGTGDRLRERHLPAEFGLQQVVDAVGDGKTAYLFLQHSDDGNCAAGDDCAAYDGYPTDDLVRITGFRLR
ncbi:protein of unknown function [Candidatus Methylocalor cossyra]|uniref:Uncharacterized protein n=1 Tax=Candidatus Methylocalor cossyra TaxID=3108543 RepID=A0ABP1C9F6_9GAMM